MSSEQLKNMLNNLINEKSEEASLDFKNYVTSKVREMISISEGASPNISLMDKEVKILSGKHKGQMGYINKLIGTDKAEVQLDDDGDEFYITIDLSDVEIVKTLSEEKKNETLKQLLDPKTNWWEQIDAVKKAFASKEISDAEVETWANSKIDKDKNVSSLEMFGDGVYLIPSGADYFTDQRDTDWISNYLIAHLTGESKFDELEDFAKKNGSKGICIISAYNGGDRNEVAFIGCKPSEIKVLGKGLSAHYTASDFDESIADEDNEEEVDNITTFAGHYFGGVKKFIKDYAVSKKAAMSFLDIEEPNTINVLDTPKGTLIAVAEND